MDIENRLSNKVIGKAIEVHKILGPGLLESAYKECLYHELMETGFTVRKEISLPVVYKSITLDQGYRIDLLINDKVVIEVKTIDSFNDVHLAQVLTYLRFGGYKLGLLINFNTTKLKNGLKRVIL